MAALSFDLTRVDTSTSARRGVLHTSRGDVQTPTFMPVGTQGTVKGVALEQLEQTGAEIILGNTYHLALRPGEHVVKELGGLHGFSGWSGPILTDSGGFQIFSLAENTKITDEGAIFRSHLDGSRINLTPERSIEIQEALGSDIAMVLDHVIALPASLEAIRDACDRTIDWAKRCRDAQSHSVQAQFAIVQGGLDEKLRISCAERLVSLDFPGYAVGGLSVGEAPEEMYRCLDYTCPALPTERPRYLMGVGRPEDILHSVARGIDMFDCVMPTRNGRNAYAFTFQGKLKMRNQVHQRDERPLEEDCPCPACRRSRGYIRHLFMANEMLGPILLSIHNLTFYQRLMQRCRKAIERDEYSHFMERTLRELAGTEA